MRPSHLASLAFLTGLLRLAVADNATSRRAAAKQGERRLAGAENTTTILGGTPAAAGEFPFYVHVINDYLCGGSLIYEDIVLTAAHCFEAWYDANAIIGSIQKEGFDGAEMVEVESVHQHPKYVPDTTREFDIMIVKLASPSGAPVIQLNQNAEAPTDGTPVTVMGFGTTSEGGITSPRLLKVDITTYAFSVCQANLPLQLFPESQICAGDIAGGRDSCQGDSGM
jgi:trypsin